MSHVALGAVLGVAISVFLIAFQVLIWRTTRIGGFGVLALLVVIGSISNLMLPLVIRELPRDSQMLYSIGFSFFLGLVTLLAWWNIYVQIKRRWVGA